MGKKPPKPGWPEAKERSRLNRNDVQMAKRLGFRPDSLIRAGPGPKDKWKLPVNLWVRELHREHFGHVPGETLSLPDAGFDEDEQRRFEEQLYWEDYRARNEEDTGTKKDKGNRATKATGARGRRPGDNSES